MAESIADLNITLRATGEKLAADINRGIAAAQSQVSVKAIALGNVIAAGITSGMSKLAGALKSTLSESINLAASFETTSTAFRVLLGDAEKAKAMLSGLRELDQQSPLDFTALTESGKVLLGFGASAESVLPTLRMLGDISLGNSEKFKSLTLAFAQTQAAGRLMGQEVLQFVNAGFNPLQEISRKTGESMLQLKDRMEDGKISAAEVTQAFISATSEGGRFFGGMAEGAKTFEGRMAKVTSGINMAMVEIGTGINNALKPVLEDLANELEKLSPLAIQIGKDIGAWATEAYKSAGGISGMMSAAVEVAATIADWAQYFIRFKDLISAGITIINTGFEGIGTRIGAAFAVGKEGAGVFWEYCKVKTLEIKNGFINLGYELELAFTKGLNKLMVVANAAASAVKGVAGGAGKAVRSESWRKAQEMGITDQPNPEDMLPSGGGGGPDATLFDMSPPPAMPENMVVDYTGLNNQIELYKTTSQEAFRVVSDASTQGADDMINAAESAYDAMTEPLPAAGNAVREYYKTISSSAKTSAVSQIATNNEKNAATLASDIAKGQQVEAIVNRERDAKIKAALDAAQAVERANTQSYDAFRQTGQRTITDMVTAWATGTGRISDIVNQWAGQMIQQFVQLSLFGNKSGGGSIGGILGGLSGMGSSGSSGGSGWANILGSVIGGFFADGGRPPMGKVSVVGENGPELFVPDSAGKIIPNHQAASYAGGGGSQASEPMAPPIIINQSFQTGVTRAELAGAMDQMQDATKGAVLEGVRRGGGYRKSLQS